MKFLLFISVLLSVLIFACEDEKSANQIIDIDSSAGIDLREVQDGDMATYVLYQSSCSNGFKFTGDTLVVTIQERNDSTFLQEKYTAGSVRETSAEHLIIEKEGYVLIPQRFNSEFLFFYGNDTIFLDRKPEIELVQSGCKLYHDNEEFGGDFIGSIEEFQFGDVRITNKKGISCVPGSFFQLDAYIIYEDYLNMIHIIQSNGEDQNIFGFIAI